MLVSTTVLIPPRRTKFLRCYRKACCAELLTAQPCDRALERLWSLEAQPTLQALFDTLVV